MFVLNIFEQPTKGKGSTRYINSMIFACRNKGSGMKLTSSREHFSDFIELKKKQNNKIKMIVEKMYLSQICAAYQPLADGSCVLDSCPKN